MRRIQGCFKKNDDVAHIFDSLLKHVVPLMVLCNRCKQEHPLHEGGYHE